MTERDWSQFFHLSPMAKARPRVTRRGTFMPDDYMRWRKAFCAACHRPHAPISVPFSVRVIIRTKTGKMRPDLDNAGSAVLDALQDARVIRNDKDAARMVFILEKSTEPGINVSVEWDD